MELLIIRHGETLANTLNHYYGFTDSPVTEKGKIQAKAAGIVVERTKFIPDVIYISERERTRITLDIMGFDSNKAVVDGRINEQHMGIFENMTFEEIGKKYPSEFKDWNKDFINYKPKDGESKKELYDRVKNFFIEITKLNEKNNSKGNLEEDSEEKNDSQTNVNNGKKILVICHGGVMSSFYTYLIGENFNETYSAYFGNCAMMKVRLMSGKLVMESLIAAEDFMKVIGE